MQTEDDRRTLCIGDISFTYFVWKRVVDFRKEKRVMSALHNYGILCGMWFLLSWVEFFPTTTSAGILLLTWLALGGHNTVYLLYHTLGRDIR